MSVESVSVDPGSAASPDAAALAHRPLLLPSNPVPSFYAGGRLWRQFRGEPDPQDCTVAEDWVASCIPTYAAHRAGRTDGLSRVQASEPVLLRDVIEAAPLEMLGQAAFERFGADPKIQVKLVSPRDRVPVHTHPDREFARSHFGVDCGKAEAWILVETTDDEHAVAGIGFREHATETAFLAAVEAQDTAAILDLLHTTPIKAGDVLFVEPGVPHFIGGGTFFVEIQEPADLGVLAEWQGFVDSPTAAAGGLDPELALTTFVVRPQTREAALGAAFQQPRVHRTEPGGFVERSLFSPGVESIFQARRLEVSTFFEPDDQRYYVAVVMAGAGWLEGDGWSQPIAAGQTFACAASLRHRYRAGAETLQVIRAFGPVMD